MARGLRQGTWALLPPARPSGPPALFYTRGPTFIRCPVCVVSVMISPGCASAGTTTSKVSLSAASVGNGSRCAAHRSRHARSASSSLAPSCAPPCAPSCGPACALAEGESEVGMTGEGEGR